MLASASHKPECGTGSRRRPLLGIRPGIDVSPAADGIVESRPERGMSVAPSPELLPPHDRPWTHGGISVLPCWSFKLAALPATLRHVATSERHGVFSNVEPVSFDDLQATLCSTAESWTLI